MVSVTLRLQLAPNHLCPSAYIRHPNTPQAHSLHVPILCAPPTLTGDHCFFTHICPFLVSLSP